MTGLGSQTVTDSNLFLSPKILKQVRLELSELDYIKDTLIIHAEKDSILISQLSTCKEVSVSKSELIRQKDDQIKLREEDVVLLKKEIDHQKKIIRKQKIITIATGVGAVILMIVLL